MLFLPNEVLKSLQNQLSVCRIYEDKVGVYSHGYADADSLSSYFPFITDKEMQSLAAAYPDDVTQVSGHFFLCEMPYKYLIMITLAGFSFRHWNC